jgi:hypothetical protein
MAQHVDMSAQKAVSLICLRSPKLDPINAPTRAALLRQVAAEKKSVPGDSFGCENPEARERK